MPHALRYINCNRYQPSVLVNVTLELCSNFTMPLAALNVEISFTLVHVHVYMYVQWWWLVI